MIDEKKTGWWHVLAFEFDRNAKRENEFAHPDPQSRLDGYVSENGLSLETQ
jgi:hypothetical protein